MYTRLYTQMLNRHHWAEAVESFISVHDESAVLGIDGACDADYVQDLIKVRYPNLYLRYHISNEIYQNTTTLIVFSTYCIPYVCIIQCLQFLLLSLLTVATPLSGNRGADDQAGVRTSLR